jgi:hypothetical protein
MQYFLSLVTGMTLMSFSKSHAAHRKLSHFQLASAVLLVCGLLVSGSAFAKAWKPICPVGSTCNSPYLRIFGHPFLYADAVANPHGIGPLATDAGFMLFHSPVGYPQPAVPKCHAFSWSSQSLEDTGDPWAGGGCESFSDLRAVELSNGDILSVQHQTMRLWTLSGNDESGFEWNDHHFKILNLADISYPPVVVGDAVYVSMKPPPFGVQTVWLSQDQGKTWIYEATDISLGDDRYSLLGNPEQTALWAISEESAENPAHLWESEDHGVNWTQVDDGSFPVNTMRVVHNPQTTQVSYALTSDGLFVSRNRGVTWQATALTESVNGLVFVGQGEATPAAMVAGTASGILLSLDNGENWSDMSSGLLRGSYTVSYSDGQLLATGDAGYFTCNGLDCAGSAQVSPPADGEGLIEVVEYYHSILGHYFITGSASEKAMLDQTDSGAGWQRTGESFLAWAPGDKLEGSNMCRFYGSQVIGPNSHFYSDSALECRMLQELQDATPDGQPRWNLEGWGMTVMPRAASDSQPCPDYALSVYRVYNNGFALGKDSNHRYVTKPELLDEMTAQGWINEGVAFCSPLE